ncbi:MAG: transporter substrate-binding domain-containing protein [Clostridia bacterium]|nr:transporter substrate-binding domain-containing protein [Clostridia bacterium]
MKKLLMTLTAALLVAASALGISACGKDPNTIYVDTNAYFAPFEYYGGEKGTEIMGVDIDIMNMVGEKLGKNVKFINTDFDVIIDNVESGKKYDCGAAGITITEERQEKVAFSNPYFTSVQYVIVKNDSLTKDGTTTDGVDYILWDSLAGKTIGVQRDTTGDIYANDEIDSEKGTLHGSGAEVKQFDNAQLAVDAIGIGNSLSVDLVVVDKLPAQFIVNNNSNYQCYALYYDEETATEEQYAICVTKGNDELLSAINAVLTELGTSGINALVSKHLGLN